MKHPALARVFSVVLAIVALIELAVGIRGLGKNEQERAERDTYAERFAGRIENYRSLHAELAAQPDYDRKSEALKTFAAAHEKAAGRHRTDTAIYTATKGGLKMGENLIIAGREELLEAKAQLRDPATRDALLESTLSQLFASVRGGFPWLENMANAAGSYADKCYQESDRLLYGASRLRNLMQYEPQQTDGDGGDTVLPPVPDEPPVEPVPPAQPVMPDLGDATEEERAAAFAEAAAAYQAACDAYAAEYAQYQQELFAYNVAAAEREAAAQRGAAARQMEQEYFANHEAWEEQCRSIRAQEPFPEAGEAIHALCTALASLEDAIRQNAPEIWREMSADFPDPAELEARGNAAAAEYSALTAEACAAMSNEEFLAYADEGQETLGELGDSFFRIGATLTDPSHLLVRAMDELNLTDTVVGFIEETLKKAEHQLQAALEELWYQEGELKKDQAKLAAQKHGLDSEAKVLAEHTAEVDSLKDLRSRHNSARLVLINVPEVKERMTDEESLPDAAEAYLETYREETERLFRGRRLISILAIAGGAMGAAGIPAAYELIRKRFWLLTPVLLCMGLSAAAELLNLRLGMGQLYVSLFTAILALVQLLIILPRKKRPRST